MTAPSAARLVTLSAIVVALAAAVGITGGPRATVERPFLVPDFLAAEVTKIELVGAGAPPITIEIDDAGMRVVAPVPGPADEATVRDLLSAITAARADRVVRGPVASPTGAGVRVERRGQPPLFIQHGAPVPASGQAWLGIGDRAYLVPAWVSEALDRELPMLRRRQVFPPVVITGVEIHGRGVDLVLAGSPLRRRDEGASTRVARAAVGRLDAVLAAVVLDILVAGDASISDVTARVLGGAAPHELNVHGPCPGHPAHQLVSGSAGVGCVRATIVDDVVAAAAVLASPAGMERALAPGAGADIESIRSGDVTLARRGAGWVLTLGDERLDADDDAVDVFFQALAVEGVPGPRRPGRPIATWTVTLLGGASETWHWSSTAVRRDDEPRALQLSAVTLAAVGTLGPPLRSLTLLVIDAPMVNAIRATGAHPATLARGQLVGEWNPPSASAQAIVDLLATFRGERWLAADELGAIRRTLELSIDAPPIPGGNPTSHTIAVGAARPGDRCAARVDAHLPIELSAAHCAALLAPLVE